MSRVSDGFFSIFPGIFGVIGIGAMAILFITLAAIKEPSSGADRPLPVGKLLVRGSACGGPVASKYGQEEYHCTLTVLASDATPVLKLKRIMVEDGGLQQKEERSDVME